MRLGPNDARARSRSPPPRPGQPNLLAEGTWQQIPSASLYVQPDTANGGKRLPVHPPGSNAHAAYNTYLTMECRDKCNDQHYIPHISYGEHSKDPRHMRNSQWKDHVFEYSDDLSTNQGYEQAATRLRQLRPTDLWASPPCTCHSCMQNLNVGRRTPLQEARFKTKMSRCEKIWENVMKLCLLQHHLGGRAHVENPIGCLTWHLKDKYTKQFLEVSHRARRDQCRDGLTDPDTGGPIPKGTRIQTTSLQFRDLVQLRCDGHQGLEHTHLMGGTPMRRSAFYPVKFCRAMAKAMLTLRDNIVKNVEALAIKVEHDYEEASTAVPSDEECDLTDEDPEWQSCYASCEVKDSAYAGFQDPSLVEEEHAEEKVIQQNARYLMNVHRNLGHPSNRLLAKILREAKAPEPVVKQAEDLQCPVCQRFRRVAPARPGGVAHATEFGECLAIDQSYQYNETDGKRSLVTHFLDEANTYHVTVTIREGNYATEENVGNIDADELLAALKEHWLKHFPRPDRIHCDSEGVFQSGKFHKFCGDRNIRIKVCAGEAH